MLFFSFLCKLNTSEIVSDNIPVFVFFADYYSCASCNYFNLNQNITLIEKKYPDALILVYLKIADSSLIDNYINNKIKSKNINYLTPDFSDTIEKKLSINNYPTLIIYNFNGNELMRFHGKEFDNLSEVKLSSKTFYSNLINPISVKFSIGVPNTQSIVVSNNVVHYVDMVKNEIGKFSLLTGDSIQSIKPDSTLLNYSLDRLNSSDEKWVNDKMYPLSNYKFVIPIDNKNLYCLSTNVSNVTTDTSFIQKNNTNVANICKLIKIKNIVSKIKDGKTDTIFEFPNNDISYNHLKKMNNNMYTASITQQDKKKILKNKKLYDSAFICVQAKNINFENSEYVISYADIMKEYSLDSISLYSLGLIEFSPETNSYIYLNPFITVFFSYNTTTKIINKFEAKGLLSELFKQSSNFSLLNSHKTNNDYEYFLMEWFINNDEINILILPRNKKKNTQFIVVSKYNLNGEFLGECYYSYADKDVIFRAHLFGDNRTGYKYLLVQSKLHKWQIIRF